MHKHRRLFNVLCCAPHALRENVDLACLTSVCDAEQLYTDAGLLLDASTHVAAASGSGAIVINLHFILIAFLGARLIVIREDQVHLQIAQVQCVTF
jgi:hypothetical protein